MSRSIIFIVGPTAVGKSEVALSVAREIKGEIISCDSMQIYKEINIASSKPSAQEIKKVPHHLVNVMSVCDEFDVARFNTLANAAVKDILARGRIPIIVGGSGLYMQILLDGIFESSSRDELLREKLKQEAEVKGNAYLYDWLKKHDPQAASKIHVNDMKRIVRALEVCLTQKTAISQLQKNRAGLWGKYDITVIGLNQKRENLYERINGRVESMFQSGLIDEIKNISVLHLSKTAQGLIGIKEILSYLRRENTLDEAKENMKQNTRHLAKKQLTWFRKEKRIQWIDVDGKIPSVIAAEILRIRKENPA